MHASSLENMQWCFSRYAAPVIHGSSSEVTVLDVGGANVNGSYADVFNQENVRYLGMDLVAGPGVDIVMEDPYRFPVADASVDFVVSGQMLEHCEFFWLAFSEMVRVLKPEGFIFLIAPSGGPIHRYPVDCYRYYPDAYRALAKYAHCHLVDMRHDERGPWNDLVGVFARTARERALPHPSALPTTPAPFTPSQVAAEEAASGQRPYLEVLAEIHDVLRPRAYLEIGVQHGRSLQLARCQALGVDPSPNVRVQLPATAEVVRMTSDDFFELEADRIRALSPNLVFIDGMHLFEFALRDFMNVERLLGNDAIVVVDDIFPNHPAQARRERVTRAWTGDVWRLVKTLQVHRPDLTLCMLDTAPTGLLVIVSLRPENRLLWQRYNPLVKQAQSVPEDPPSDVLNRKGAIEPRGETLKRLLDLLLQYQRDCPPTAKSVEALRRGVRELVAPTMS